MTDHAERQSDSGDDHLGRTARVHAAGECHRLLSTHSTKGPTEKGPAELAGARYRDQAAGQREKPGFSEDREVRIQAGQRKKHRHEKSDDKPAKLLVDMSGQNRRLADENSGDEGAEHG